MHMHAGREPAQEEDMMDDPEYIGRESEWAALATAKMAHDSSVAGGRSADNLRARLAFRLSALLWRLRHWKVGRGLPPHAARSRHYAGVLRLGGDGER